MQMETPLTPEENRMFGEIFKKHYDDLLRAAGSGLRGMHLSADLAGDVVHSVFMVAANRRGVLFGIHDDGEVRAWLMGILKMKIREYVRDENRNMRRIMKVSETIPLRVGDQVHTDFRLRLELSDLIPPEDYLLLKRLYLVGCTYDELAAEMGVGKSALAMRVKRIKERFIKEYEKSEKLTQPCEQTLHGGHYVTEEVLEDARQ